MLLAREGSMSCYKKLQTEAAGMKAKGIKDFSKDFFRRLCRSEKCPKKGPGPQTTIVEKDAGQKEDYERA
jgi:hypothetical protein